MSTNATFLSNTHTIFLHVMDNKLANICMRQGVNDSVVNSNCYDETNRRHKIKWKKKNKNQHKNFAFSFSLIFHGVLRSSAEDLMAGVSATDWAEEPQQLLPVAHSLQSLLCINTLNQLDSHHTYVWACMRAAYSKNVACNCHALYDVRARKQHATIRDRWRIC